MLLPPRFDLLCDGSHKFQESARFSYSTEMNGGKKWPPGVIGKIQPKQSTAARWAELLSVARN